MTRLAKKRPLIPSYLMRSTAFKKDLELLAGLKPSLLNEVKRVATSLAVGGSPDVLEALTEEIQGELRESPGPVSALALLQGRAAEHRISPDRIRSELADLLDTDSDLTALSEAIVVPEDTVDEVLAKRAFGRPPYLCTSSFQAILRQTGSRLVAGLEWTIAYHDSHDDHVSFVFGLTRAQAKTLLRDLEAALQDLEGLGSMDIPEGGSS